MKIAREHPAAAHAWFSNPAHNRLYFVGYCRQAGYPIDRFDGVLVSDWQNIATPLFDLVNRSEPDERRAG